MRLHDKAAANELVAGGRKHQLSQKALLGAAKADDRGVLQAAEIKRVPLKGEDRKLAGLRVELLTIAVLHDDTRARRRVYKGGALRQDRDRLLPVSAVVDQEPDDIAVRLTVADVESEVVRNRRKCSL